MKQLDTYILILLLAGTAVLSCRREEIPVPESKPEYPAGKTPILAQPYIDEDWMPITKSPSDITEVGADELQESGFGLYAFYTGTESYSSAKDSSDYANFGLVLNNRQYTYSGSAWQNAGVPEFWPASKGDKLTLLAYAPYDTWHDKVSYDGMVPSIVYDDYVAQSLTASELSKQRDILWGTNSAGLPHRDVEKDDFSPEGTADIHFRHAVAKVQLMARSMLSWETTSYLRQDNNPTVTGTPGPDTPSDAEGSAGTAEGLTTTSNVSASTSSRTYVLYTYWKCTEVYTETQSFVQTQRKADTQSRTSYWKTEGKRYLIDNISFHGFHKTGTLTLDNSAAYAPNWVGLSSFDGEDPEYVLSHNGSDVLPQALRYVPTSTISSNYPVYTGVPTEAIDLLDGYHLYVIPKLVNDPSDQVQVTLHYHVLDIGASDDSGNLTSTDTRLDYQSQQRVRTRTRTKTRISEEVGHIGWWEPNNVTWQFNDEFEDLPWDSGTEDGWGEWGGSYPGFTHESYGEWTEGSQVLNLSKTSLSYTQDKTLEGSIASSFEGGRAYTLTFVLSGDKMGIDVTTRPWELEEASYDYTSENNVVIQALTYDSDYVDYADAAGNVYINNRMGKFYFRLGTGKYVAWQASLVGDPAFGFTDENGNFLLDESGHRVSFIKSSIDPDVMNYIYVKAIDNTATVTSRAKLRIYYIDASNEVTAALNLVNLQDVNEWTIVQNAN